MNHSGISRICISVKDMMETIDFYTHTVGLKIVGEGMLSKEMTYHLYDVSETTARYVMLKNHEQPTLLQLIEFVPNKGRFIREGRASWDYGYYDMAFRVKDNASMHSKLTEDGYLYTCPPYQYTADWVNVTVSEAVAIGPNYVPMAMIQRLTEPIPQFEGNFSIITDVAQTIEDANEAIRFYSEILGLNKVFDAVLPQGLVDPVVGMPPGTQTRMILFAKDNTPLVELLEYSVKGRTMSDIAVPPNIGLFATAFQVENLETMIELLRKNNITIKSGPMIMNLSPYGSVQTIIVEGPSKTMVELYQCV